MEKTLYPLTMSQNLMFYEMDLMPYKQIVNICVEFEFKCDIDKSLMMQAINLSLMRNPNNYVRIVKQGKQLMQYFTEDSLDKIEYLEFETEEAYQKSLKKFNCTPFENKHIESQLFRVRLFKKPNGTLTLGGCFSHVIYDAYSIMMAFKDICDCYKALLHNLPIPEAKISPIKAYEDDYKYYGSERQKADDDYIRNVLFATEPQFTTINGKDYKSNIKGKRYGKFEMGLKMSAGMLNIPISKEFNDKIVEFATSHKVTAEAVYMLAARTFLANVCEVDDVLIDSVIGRRTTLAQKKAGGSMADGTFVRTVFGTNLSFIDSLNETYKSILENYKHANYGAQAACGIYHSKFNCPQKECYHTFLLTYQMETFVDDEIKYKFTRLDNGKEISNVYLSVMPCDSENNYVANYAYQADFVKEEKIREFHNFIMAFIEEGMKDENASCDELIKRV